MIKILSLLAVLVLASSSNGCIEIFKSGYKTYFVNAKQQTWKEAYEQCKAIPRGRLVRIQSFQENVDLEKILKKFDNACYDDKRRIPAYWTSGIRHSNNKFYWLGQYELGNLQDTSMRYTNWNINEPNNYNNKENCVEINHHSGQMFWNDLDCDAYTLCSVCEV